MCTGTSGQVVDEYEERARKIDSLRERLEATKSSIQSHADKITTLKERSGRKGEGGREENLLLQTSTRGRSWTSVYCVLLSTKSYSSWLEPLKELLQRVGENFRRFFNSMQCAGEVHLLEDEASRWAGLVPRGRLHHAVCTRRLSCLRTSASMASTSVSCSAAVRCCRSWTPSARAEGSAASPPCCTCSRCRESPAVPSGWWMRSIRFGGRQQLDVWWGQGRGGGASFTTLLSIYHGYHGY